MKAIVLSPAVAHGVHFLFEWLAIGIGMQLYRRQRRNSGGPRMLDRGHYGVVIGCILGAAIGNKLVFWIDMPQLWQSARLDASVWMSGQSIVGGLLGGLIGIEPAKKLTGVRESTGDHFVLPLVVGTVVGRAGCFLAGLNDGTYGNATALPWGVDFGDGVARHPTQLYEMLFLLLWGGVLLRVRPVLRAEPGLMFKLYLSGYLLWRLLVDSIKPVPHAYPFGLSGIQLVCAIALIAYLPLALRQLANLRRMKHAWT